MADLTYAAPVATVGAQYVWPINLIDEVTNLPPADGSGNQNLGSYVADVQIRTGPGAAILLEASTANGQIAINNAGLVLTFPGPSITTQGQFMWELKLTDTAGIVSKPIGGVFLITPSVTP